VVAPLVEPEVLPLVPRLPEVLVPRLLLLPRRALPEVVAPLVEVPEVLLIEPEFEPAVVLIEPEPEVEPLVEPTEEVVLPLVEPAVVPSEPAVLPLVVPAVVEPEVLPVAAPAVVPVVWAKAALVVSPKPSTNAAARSDEKTCFFIDTERERVEKVGWVESNWLLASCGARAGAAARATCARSSASTAGAASAACVAVAASCRRAGSRAA